MTSLALETSPPAQRNDILALGRTPKTFEISQATTSNQTKDAPVPVPQSATLEDRPYENSKDVKIDFGQFVRHLSNDWRRVIFQDIDRLLSPADWDDESALINTNSFKTFLRFLTYTPPANKPVLGVNHDGSLLAAWIKDDRQISVSFLPNDQAKAILAGTTPRGEEEILAWQGNVASLQDFIARNGAIACLK
jgi:hypothetical protein